MSERDYLLLQVWRICREQRERPLGDDALWAKLQEAFDYVREFKQPAQPGSRRNSSSVPA